MNTAKKFINAVAGVFQSEIERERAALAEIERKRAEREARLVVVRRAADLRDRLESAKAAYSNIVKEIDRVSSFQMENVFADFVASKISPEEVGARISALESLGRHAKTLKKFAHEQIIETAVEKLRTFEREHTADLRGVVLTPSEEAPFIPANLPKDFYETGGSAKFVQAGIAPN
jgi:hypothetical protein